MTDNPAPLAVEAKKSKGLWRRALGLVVSVGLIVVIFVGVIPQFASYADAWTAIQSMSTAWLVALIVAAAVNQISYVWPYQAVLVHLRYRHGFFETQTSSAISNTVPAGGAVAIGMTFRMFGSFGFSNVAVSTAVGTTGVWIWRSSSGCPSWPSSSWSWLARAPPGRWGPPCSACSSLPCSGWCCGWCSAAMPAPIGSGAGVTGR